MNNTCAPALLRAERTLRIIACGGKRDHNGSYSSRRKVCGDLVTTGKAKIAAEPSYGDSLASPAPFKRGKIERPADDSILVFRLQFHSAGDREARERRVIGQ